MAHAPALPHASMTPHTVSPHDGTLLVLTPGLGAVSTTFMAGVELIRRGDEQAHRLAHADADAAPRGAL